MDDAEGRVPGSDHGDEREPGAAPAAQIPRWYGPSLVALGAAVVVCYVAMGGEVTALGVALGAVVIAVVAGILVAVRFSHRSEPPAGSSPGMADGGWGSGSGIPVFLAVAARRRARAASVGPQRPH